MSNPKRKGNHYYFGFGSNMSKQALALKLLSNKDKLRHTQPYSSFKAYLNGYKLNFSLTTKRRCNPGFANIIKTDGYQVHGCVSELDEQQFKLMDSWEICYERILVDVYQYHTNKIFKAYAYICTPEVLKRKNLSHLGYSLNDNTKPGYNYLMLIIDAAKTVGLNKNYIHYLQNVIYEPHPNIYIDIINKYDKMLLNELFNLKMYTMDDIQNVNHNLMCCAGMVLDISNITASYKKKFKNKDVTNIMCKRWWKYKYYINESNDDIKRKLDAELQLFVTGMVLAWFESKGKCPYGKVVGMLNHDICGSQNYGWNKVFNDVQTHISRL